MVKAVNDMIGLALLGGLIFGGYKLYKVTFMWPPAVQQMWELVQWSPKVRDLFGDDISKSLMWDGTFKADAMAVSIPITGGSGVKGTIYGRAVLVDGAWQLIGCSVVVAGQESAVGDGIRDDMGAPRGVDASGNALAHGGAVDVLEERLRAAGQWKAKEAPAEMMGHGVPRRSQHQKQHRARS